MGERDWLRRLRVGSEVIVRGRQLPAHIATVEHASSTMVTVEGRRYRRSDGNQTMLGRSGHGAGHRKLIEPTREAIEALHHEQEVRRLDRLIWQTYTWLTKHQFTKEYPESLRDVNLQVKRAADALEKLLEADS